MCSYFVCFASFFYHFLHLLDLFAYSRLCAYIHRCTEPLIVKSGQLPVRLRVLDQANMLSNAYFYSQEPHTSCVYSQRNMKQIALEAAMRPAFRLLDTRISLAPFV